MQDLCKNAPRVRMIIEQNANNPHFDALDIKRALKRAAFAETDLNEVLELLSPDRAQFFSPNLIEEMSEEEFFSKFPIDHQGIHWDAQCNAEWEAQLVARIYRLAISDLQILLF